MKNLHKLTIKKLVKLCIPSLKILKWEFTTMSHEEKIISILKSVVYEIYKRNQNKCSSLKFSDYLKNEPYLDHYLIKICRESTLKPKNEIKKKAKQTKKFGIFDVSKLEKKKKDKLEIKPKLVSKSEIFDKLE